jgi:hypothetical protein
LGDIGYFSERNYEGEVCKSDEKVVVDGLGVNFGSFLNQLREKKTI